MNGTADDVVLKAASYRRMAERHRAREVELVCAKEDRDRAWKWARDCLAQERELTRRCVHLYGLAARYGATDEELAGPG